MILKTERVVLRPFKETDAEAVYEFAQDERVGPIAGWPPHKSVEESAEIVKTVLSGEGIYAVTLKGDDSVIGCVGLVRGALSNFPIGDEEGEVSYWLGVPYWGRGLIPEAVGEVIRYGFEELNLKAIWCGHYVENRQSRRVQEKCGFKHHHVDEDSYSEFTKERRPQNVSRLTKEQWLAQQE